MPIRNCSIFSFKGNNTTVILPIKIVNPHSNLSYKTFGLTDTGATECAIPSKIAKILGHNLENGTKKEISTGNGLAIAYGHTSIIEIYHPQRLNKPAVFILKNVLIDFMPNLNVPLLGVNNFLSNFTLIINYPKRIFSLIQ